MPQNPQSSHITDLPKSQTVERSRRLGLHHFAFLRGWAQGLDLGELGERYLGEDGSDLRVIRSALDWLRQECMLIARRAGRPRDAAALNRCAALMPPSPALPSLDDFAGEFPEGFYSESELQELYTERFGILADRPAKRRAHLIDRQLEALKWLESFAAEPVRPGHLLDGWLSPVISARLRSAEIFTVSELITFVQLYGKRWWTKVPRVGPKGGARIERFLAIHFEAGALTLPSPALPVVLSSVDVSAGRVCVVPLEALDAIRSNTALSGSLGSNRANTEKNRLGANDDLSAIRAWLSTHEEGSSTWRAYRKESERLLLWALVERSKPLSSLTVEDCVAYRDFLYNPQPIARWVGEQSRERWSPRWKPFGGPLSPISVRHALVILRLMCEWLVRQRYLDANPWQDVPTLAAKRSRMNVSRSFSVAQWELIADCLQRLPPSPATSRLRFVLAFAEATGLRLSELTQAKLGDFRLVDLAEEGSGWVLSVLGKGKFEREVPIIDSTAALVERYLQERGFLPDLAAAPGETSLLARVDGREGEGVSDSTIYQSLKSFFAWAAEDIEAKHKDSPSRLRDAKQIRSASTHWLRHTFGTQFVSRGGDIDVLRDLLGHASISTTSVYVNSEHRRRFAQMREVGERKQG